MLLADVAVGAKASPAVVGFLQALLPTLEGAFQFTVLPGGKSEVMIRFHLSTRDQVVIVLEDICGRFPGELELEAEIAGIGETELCLPVATHREN